MLIIILSALLILVACKFNKFIKKHFNILCIVIFILGTLSYWMKELSNPINAGYLGFAFFIVVMFQSAFKKGGNFYRKTLSVRKEYSIFGFIFLIPHALIFLIGENQVLEWNGIISFLIMIPLFITSFIIIRKKMTVKQWKILHLLSYLAYILMFAHVIMVSGSLDRIIYSLIIGIYLFLKIKNNGFSKLDTIYKKSIALSLLFITICINLYVFNISNDFIDVQNSLYNDGIYYGEATGFKGNKVKVNVEVQENSIIDIQVIEFGGTEPHEGTNFEQAVDELSGHIVESQSLEVDTISGATKSTTGLKKAVNNALKEAVKIENEE
ncbi:FMN-binding protein [Vallitalea okinawensis]|uniref:FMN-binding protein n=1 Tax=Vallitalea okinawensis TaxID=2078660 RepID=UPI000CFCB089|nr:FMN-binding protein [Vallitalea okinawensis]